MKDDDAGNGPEADARDTAPRKPDRIEAHLKRAFSETLEEPLPEGLAALVAKLKQGSDAR